MATTNNAARRKKTQFITGIFNGEGNLPSPCIAICKMNAQTGLCEGCWRTLNEIAMWGTASESEKQDIWREIHHRIQRQFEQDVSALDP